MDVVLNGYTFLRKLNQSKLIFFGKSKVNEELQSYYFDSLCPAIYLHWK